MSEVWRVFAAIDLTNEIRERIATTAQLLQDAGWQARWSPTDRAHMTVRFYGDLELPTIQQLQNELRDRLARQPAFELQVSRVGAFPNPKRPRVIWLGIDDPFDQLGNLKQLVDEASAAAGLEPEPGPYRPHLTVGRLLPTFKIGRDEAVETFERFGDYEPIPWIASSVQLIRSQLGRGGAQYTVIEEFPFAPPDGTVSEQAPDEEDEETMTTEELDSTYTESDESQ